MMKTLCYTLLVQVIMWANVSGQEIIGKIVGVHDGDSITLLTAEKQQLKVRLEGIDAPELKQAFGMVSKQALSDLVYDKTVRLRVTGKDRYQRTLGNVFIGRSWVNLAMVEQGLAWHYVKYSKDEKLSAAEARARSARLGVWRDKQPVAPWDWRPKRKTKTGPR